MGGIPRQSEELRQLGLATGRAFRVRGGLLVAFLILLAGSARLGGLAADAAEPDTPSLVSDGRYAMGTALEMTLVTRDGESGRAALDAAFELVASLESIFTTWEAGSDTSRLNRRAGAGPERVAPALGDLLARSVALTTETKGAFDVTVGPLIALWRSAGERGRAPTPDELTAARALVGASRLAVDPNGVVDLPRAGMSVNFGAIAKGYALDQAVPLLRRHGVRAALLSFGQSSLRAFGRPPGDTVWRVALRDAEGGIAGVLALENEAASVSRSLGQWVEIGGRRYGHVIDPRTGEPLVRNVQATVIARSATRADALSTALLVLEPDEGIGLVANAAHTEARLVLAESEVRETPGFGRGGRWAPAPVDQGIPGRP